MKDILQQLIDRLRVYKPLPDYQIERRIDLLFSLFLPAVLNNKFSANDFVIVCPEFPVKSLELKDKRLKLGMEINLDDIKQIADNSSTKIDYLCYSKQKDKILLVELKTDISSFNLKQYWYYRYYTEEVNWQSMWDFVKSRCTDEGSRYWKKYLYLVNYISKIAPDLSDVAVIESLDMLSKKSLKEAMESTKELKPIKLNYLYISPNLSGKKKAKELMDRKELNLMTLSEYAGLMENVSDQGKQIADLLRSWDTTPL